MAHHNFIDDRSFPYHSHSQTVENHSSSKYYPTLRVEVSHRLAHRVSCSHLLPPSPTVFLIWSVVLAVPSETFWVADLDSSVPASEYVHSINTVRVAHLAGQCLQQSHRHP